MDILINALAILIPLAIYFVRLEVNIAKLQRDICWIKRGLNKCQPPSEDHTP